MTPEQARGTRISWFTGQFSLGLILFEMAMGYPAFRGQTGLATLFTRSLSSFAPMQIAREPADCLFPYLVT
jgi:hypothetical protein